MEQHLDQRRVRLQSLAASAEMASDRNGDGKDYKVFIRSTQTRSAGRLQQHEAGDGAFSFGSPVTDGGEPGIEREQLYFDANATLPLHWESLVNSCRAHSSSSARDFEFGMVVPGAEAADQGAGIDDARFSHADELFYKGQLLPLHLRPRLQMVEKLLYENQQEKADHDDQQHDSSSCVFQAAGTTVAEPYSNLLLQSPTNLSHLFQPAYRKDVCVSYPSAEDVVPGIETTAATDSRSSSFQSHVGSYSSWESGSAADNGGSSRDSNGSSQDACFAASCCNESFDNSKKDAPPYNKPVLLKSSKEPPFLHNREVFSTHSKKQQDQSSTFSSWLRPFKWNVLFGALKKSSSKPSIQEPKPEACQTQQQINRFSESSFSFPPAPPHFTVVPPPCTPSIKHGSSCSEETASSVMLSATAEEDPPVLKATSDRERRERRSDPSHLPPKNGAIGAVLTASESSDNESGPENNDSTAPGESEKVHSMAVSGTAEERFMSNVGAGLGERSKARDRWMKYIKMLKPLYGKMPPRLNDVVKMDNNNVSISAAAATAPHATILLSRRAAGSLPCIKPAADQKKLSVSAQKTLSGSLSFLSQTSRIAYIGAPRKSNASDSAGVLLQPLSHSMISDLQCSLQVTIAHCKHSHSTQQLEDP